MNKKKSDDPITLFETWLAEAENSEPEYPEAVCLATADAAGRPSARMVLLKAVDARGFVFYTNLSSRKGHELRDNPHAALCFHWKSLRRQVRVEGPITPVDDQEADAYFASRPRLSQIGAWASRQSQPMTGNLELEKRVAQFSAKFHITQVPRPDFWSGFRLAPQCIEFWREATFRLHERIIYRRHENAWHTENLFP